MKKLLFILFLLPLISEAQPGIKKPKPNKVVAVARPPVIITPAAPTNFVVNDILNTATITLSPGYGTTDHEVSINSGSSYNTLTSLPVTGLTGNYAIGSVRFRVKAATGRNASAYVSNATAYTEDEEEEPTYPRTAGETINAATTYSIVANGSTNNATNLNSLSSAHKWSDVFKQVTTPPGQMNYSDNTWVEGLRNVRFKPSSGITQWYNTGGNEFDISHQPIATSGILNYNKKASYVGTINTGYLFSTATAGASSITASGTGLVAGDRVFLAGYECQGSGWPPNPRFFEWKEVLSVVGTTITFTTPLENSYNSLWKDWDWGGGYFFGKPRIFKIPDNYAEYVEIKDTEFLIQEGVGNAFHYPARTIILDNVELHGGAWPSENETFTAIDVFGGSWELDKCVKTVNFNNVTTTSEIQGATGVRNFNIYGGTMGGYLAITPQNFYAEGVTFQGGLAGNAAVYPFEYYTGCDTWTFKDCIFPNVQTAFEVPTLTFTIASMSSGNIVIPDNSDPEHVAHRPAKLIYQGSTIYSGGNSATVTDIIHSGGNYHLLLSNVVGTFTAGMTVTYRQIKNVVDLGGNRKENGTPITLSLPALP